MPYSIACKGGGAECPASFTTETQEELMEHIGLHTRTAHPDMGMSEQAQTQLKTLIKRA